MAKGRVCSPERLERGRFVWPAARDGKVSLTAAQLSMLLEALTGAFRNEHGDH